MTSQYRQKSILVGVVLIISIAGYLLVKKSRVVSPFIEIAVPNNRSIFLVNGQGDTQEIFAANNDLSYSNPTLTGRRVSAIESSRCDPPATCKENNRLVSYNLDTKIYGREIFPMNISYGTWSPNNKYILTLSDNERTLSILEGKKNLMELKRVSGMTISFYENARWLSDTKIIVHGLIVEYPPSLDEILATIEVPSGKVKILCRGWISNQFSDGGILRQSTDMLGENEINLNSCFKNSEASAILGSGQWPVGNLYDSSDTIGRFYFYKRWNTFGNGLMPEFTKIWVEGYDTETHQTFRVKTLKGYFE